ncbi:hypothetical protein Y71_17075 [Kosakonia radicincitans DSM 16656]|uniref:hypothetical protein n=1 Tax=Kosakonia radicincitans TaxID=283686 RepID=UPI000272E2F8|nr:hypothetical protein [Kosakonia radicincitans]ARD61554.1 hypothetical protein Y71_17075 [Kosakonia radicincitans DSM 16656]
MKYQAGLIVMRGKVLGKNKGSEKKNPPGGGLILLYSKNTSAAMVDKMKSEHSQVIYIAIGISIAISFISVLCGGFSLFNILCGPFAVIGIVAGLCIAWYSTIGINKILQKFGFRDY